MRKRLHYAMPRVPLSKLRRDVVEQGAGDEPVSHVGVIAKRIVDAKMQRTKLDGSSDDESNYHASEENRKKTKVAGLREMQMEGRGRKTEKVKVKDHEIRMKTSVLKKTTKKVEHLDLKNKEQTHLKDIEQRLRKLYKRNNLRFILVDSESSKSSSQSTVDSDSTEDDEICVSLKDVQMDVGHVVEDDSWDDAAEDKVVVLADVHHETDLDVEEQLEGAIGGVAENLEHSSRKDTVHSDETFGMMIEGHEIECSSDSSAESELFLSTGSKKGWLGRKKHPDRIKLVKVKRHKLLPQLSHQSDIQWGEDEDSTDADQDGWEDAPNKRPLL